MNAAEYWKLFMETGAPEAYLLYNKAKKMEDMHVPDDQGTGIACNLLQ